MAQATLEELTTRHEEVRDENRRRGIVEYDNGEKQSDQVWEVTDGRKYLPAGKGQPMHVLGPGNLFHPTESQVRSKALRGKAREVSRSAYESLKSGRPSVRGADIGLRSLAMEKDALAAALEAGLKEEDFAELRPEGRFGRFTLEQVQALIASRSVN